MAKRSSRHAGRAPTSNTYRFFVHPDAIRGGHVHVEESGLIHQIGDVLRLRPGHKVTLLDNSGWEHVVRIETIERHSITGAVEARQPAGGEPRLKLALYVALLKGERFEWVLQKGTELGASIFAPIICERSVVDGAAELGHAKSERWERIVREAAEQSRRGRLPVLLPPQRFSQACESAVAQAQTLLLWEGSGGTGLRQVLQAPGSPLLSSEPLSLAVFSGPEGGWTEDELATAIRYNMRLVSLGARTMRAETAPIAAAAALFYEHGDLE
jgi:16S rRNA (uracil1498-N3)-methyltransferase